MKYKFINGEFIKKVKMDRLILAVWILAGLVVTALVIVNVI